MSGNDQLATIPTIKVCVLGDGNVGKSALTIRYFQDQFVEDWDPTIEDLYTRKDILNGQFYNLEVQDTAGQQNYKVLRDMYVRESQGFLIVFSVVEQDQFNEDGSIKETSFDHVRDYYNNIREHHSNVPILLVANKIDLKSMRKVTSEMVQQRAKDLNISCIETSAKTKHNVQEAFIKVVKECIDNTLRQHNEESQQEDLVWDNKQDKPINKSQNKKRKKSFWKKCSLM